MKKEGRSGRFYKKFVDRKNSGRFAFCAVCIALVTFIIFTSSQSVLMGLGYDRSENMDELRHGIKSAWSDIYDLITGEDRDGSLKEGKLTKLIDLKVKQRHYITAEMPNVSESVYLKGYVGSVYTGSSWEDIDL